MHEGLSVSGPPFFGIWSRRSRAQGVGVDPSLLKSFFREDSVVARSHQNNAREPPREFFSYSQRKNRMYGQKGFLVELSGGVFLLLDLVGFLT